MATTCNMYMYNMYMYNMYMYMYMYM